jgi:LysR family D-serine deaminase transcriptional activator
MLIFAANFFTLRRMNQVDRGGMDPLREVRNRLLNGWQLSKLYTFEVAARHQSFALAADELSLSPSAVSHRINQLEELGIQLFVRSHRKVELTHEGKRVFWALKSSLDTLNQEILDIKNQELSGTLTVYSRPYRSVLAGARIGRFYPPLPVHFVNGANR